MDWFYWAAWPLTQWSLHEQLSVANEFWSAGNISDLCTPYLQQHIDVMQVDSTLVEQSKGRQSKVLSFNKSPFHSPNLQK